MGPQDYWVISGAELSEILICSSIPFSPMRRSFSQASVPVAFTLFPTALPQTSLLTKHRPAVVLLRSHLLLHPILLILLNHSLADVIAGQDFYLTVY